MKKEFLNPPELPDWSDVFSQVVVVESGETRTIYVAGQVSVDAERNIVGRGDLEAQAVQSLRNLQAALASAGAALTDVVKSDIFIKNYRPADNRAIRAALQQFFTHSNLPVSNWIGVQALANEDFLIEIDAIAVVPNSNLHS